MQKRATFLYRTLNVIVLVLLFWGLRQITNTYDYVYDIAANGISRYGLSIQDLPERIDYYFLYVILALLSFALSDHLKKKHSN